MPLSDIEVRLIDEKFRSRDEALRVAVNALDRRLESMNEFRETIRDQAALYITKDVFNTLDNRINQLRIDLSRFTVKLEESERTSALERAQLDKRLESMNEFRGQLKDQAAGFVTRPEMDALAIRTADSLKPNWALLAALISLLFGITAGGWLVIGLRIETAITPLAITVEHLKTIADHRTN